MANDVVNALQEIGPDVSPRSEDGPIVQTSIAQFDAAQVLSHLIQCSHGFFLGGMRPGTQIQVLNGATVIGKGEAIDGTGFVTIADGLPLTPAGTHLTARQLICPKPPLPPPSTGYLQDSALPPVAPFPLHSGQTLSAPSIADGLTECSRAVFVKGIQPGADVILEGTDRGWWASVSPSDQTSVWLQLPLELKEGENVTIRQEVAPRCELTSERKSTKVGPKQTLSQPRLAEIDCNTTPSIYGIDLKPEADVEFSVSFQQVETIYRTVATESYGPLPAPPMPAGATVKLRQGECDVWSIWSLPQTANSLTSAPNKPSIPHDLFSCQDAVPVENVSPLNGFLRIMSAKHGELRRLPPGGNIMVISVAPSLSAPDDVWVEHHICGFVAAGDKRPVHQGRDVVPGTLKAPLFDGDTEVILLQAIAGARIELWEETKNVMLEAARTPFGNSSGPNTGLVDVALSGFGALQVGWKVFVKTLHCGHFVQSAPSVLVGLRAPVLTSIAPSSVMVGHAALSLTITGDNFRPGAKVQWGGADRATTFVSVTELHTSISAADVASVKSIFVRVVNPDGQNSGQMTFTITAPPPPPPQGFDELLIQNCNTGTFSGSNIHRPIHIYYRRLDQGPANAQWSPINDSPHNSDYDANGHCPASPSAGARLALDDGGVYEVVCTDPELPGCMTGDPDELVCRKSPIISIRGKAGGGTKVVIVN
jgi:hypothetical protein